MRTLLIAACASLACGATAGAFEDRQAAPSLTGALAPSQAGLARPGRTIAAFVVDERLVTVNAYGRRARARLNGDVEGLRHERAMGRVYEGAPQPALVTLELSVKF